jgi:hypothetical protein
MNQNLPKTIMIAFGLAILVASAIAQVPVDKGAPRNLRPSRKDAAIQDDYESVDKEVPRPLRPSKKYATIKDDSESVGKEVPRPLRPSKQYATIKDDSETVELPAKSTVELPVDGVGTQLKLPSPDSGPMNHLSAPKSDQPVAGWAGKRVGADRLVSGENRLAQEAEQVARSIGAAQSDAEKEKLKDQLSDVLEKQFDFRQRRHESEIAELEAQVRKLRELVQKRQKNRREIVAKRLDVIIRDAEGLGW